MRYILSSHSLGGVRLPLHTASERLYEKASRAVLSQPSQHDADLGQATPSGEPSECSFYHPTPLKHMKPLRPDLLPVHFGPLRDPDASQAAPGLLDHLYLPAASLLHPSHKIPLLAGAIHPDELET